MSSGNVELNLGSGGAKIAVDIIGSVAYEVVKQAYGTEGTATMVDASHPLPTTDSTVASTLSDILNNVATSANQVTELASINQIATNTGLAQNSVTASQSGNLVQGATTISAPTYTTARTNPLSLTTAGALRTDNSSIAGTTVDTNSGNKSAGTQRVVLATDQPTVPVSISAPTTIYNGKKTVTTAGTAVVLASSQTVNSVVIKALQTNTGYIYIGDSSVSSTTGLQLLAGDGVSLDIANLSTVYVNSSVSGEGVTYISSN